MGLNRGGTPNLEAGTSGASRLRHNKKFSKAEDALMQIFGQKHSGGKGSKEDAKT